MVSVLYIGTWLLIRNLPSIKGLENAVCPILVSQLYYFLMVEGLIENVNGTMNPNIVTFLLFWDFAAYW